MGAHLVPRRVQGAPRGRPNLLRPAAAGGRQPKWRVAAISRRPRAAAARWDVSAISPVGRGRPPAGVERLCSAARRAGGRPAARSSDPAGGGYLNRVIPAGRTETTRPGEFRPRPPPAASGRNHPRRTLVDLRGADRRQNHRPGSFVGASPRRRRRRRRAVFSPRKIPAQTGRSEERDGVAH